jgi:3-oxoacyl-[acyl-carrier protein] reductase
MRKAALITGASRGIGQAIAQGLSADLPVILHCKERMDAALDTLDKIVEAGGTGMVVRARVESASEVDAMFEEIRDAGFWVHTLVNNAGIKRDRLAAVMNLDDWRAVMDTNLNGAFHCIKATVGGMVARKAGNIINIASVSGLHGQVGQANYAAAKSGMVGMTKSLAKELGRYGIRVNCVAPGFVETEMLADVRGNPASLAALEEAVRRDIPLRRIGQPAEVAALVQFLASTRASYMTGQVIEIDGGMCL